jgi:hypothetical protein
MDFSNMKQCSKCGEIKPFHEFVNSKKGKSGKASYCKACHREQNRNRYLIISGIRSIERNEKAQGEFELEMKPENITKRNQEIKQFYSQKP